VGQEKRGRWRTEWFLALPVLAMCLIVPDGSSVASEGARDHLKRAKVFLAAADYRRALEACQREVEEAPSAESYTYLTYVFQALDAYLEALAKEDRWVGVEHLFLNLATRDTQDLVDPPDVLARIAKEIIQDSVRRQADITAAMATRLDKTATERLWRQQTEWRKANPDGWWAGVPAEWKW
jgi:tetratricopeptide (TPR) repeat protein